MGDKKYNGWYNYATFRVHNDVLGKIYFENVVTESQLKEIVRDVVFRDKSSYYLLIDYANLFLNEVNWDEIVRIYNEDILNLQTKYDH